MESTAEGQRLMAADHQGVPWRRWGPYLSDRQWGTVREDYSENGDAWSYFTHDQARSRAYRWGEDGIAGVSDDQQHLCLALALWNDADPILKERFFGLTNAEGNHGEDVKEYYFHLDSTPTHSYMRMLYKYPQAAYPYEDLVAPTGRAPAPSSSTSCSTPGVFDEDRYFDVEVEYAKADPDDLLAAVTVTNRGPDEAPLARAAERLVPQHLGLGAHAGRGAAGPGRRRRRARSRSATPSSASGCCGSTPAPSASSPRTRPTPRGCSAARTAPPTSRTASTTCVVARPRRRREPRAHRHQGGGPPPAAGPRGRLGHRPLAAAAARYRRAARRRARPRHSTPWSPAAAPRPTSSTRRSPRPALDADAAP